MKFFCDSLLLLHLPKMNWLFRFKKVHGWNTKRGSSISPWIVRENPMAVRRDGGVCGGLRCWSLIRPWASSTQGLAVQTSILSSSTSNPLNHLRQFLHCKASLEKIFFIKCASVCVNEHLLQLDCLLCKTPTRQKRTRGVSNGSLKTNIKAALPSFRCKVSAVQWVSDWLSEAADEAVGRKRGALEMALCCVSLNTE